MAKWTAFPHSVAFAYSAATLKDAMKLNPVSPITLVEFANGLVMLEGERKRKDAKRLYEQAAAIKPLDATEWLDVALARAELANN